MILLTDGASTMDSKIPSSFKSYGGDGDNTGCVESTGSNCDYPSGGTDFLDNLALYARTTDLRADLENEQNLILYAIYAFNKDPNGRRLLRDAARNGGFEDRDGDKLPDGGYNDPPENRLEWDQDGDGEPDTYYEADDGYALQAKLLAAITDILRRASFGYGRIGSGHQRRGRRQLRASLFPPQRDRRFGRGHVGWATSNPCGWTPGAICARTATATMYWI